MIQAELDQRIREGFARWNRGEHTFDPEWVHPDVEIHSAVGVVSGVRWRSLYSCLRLAVAVAVFISIP